jgi:hypothetical protein
MIDALREERMKNTETKITERKTMKTGFVVKALLPKIGGSSKSLLLGGTKPSPSALKDTNERTHTPSNEIRRTYQLGRWGCVLRATLWGKVPPVKLD